MLRRAHPATLPTQAAAPAQATGTTQVVASTAGHAAVAQWTDESVAYFRATENVPEHVIYMHNARARRLGNLVDRCERLNLQIQQSNPTDEVRRRVGNAVSTLSVLRNQIG